ncbi:hypothetical protein ACIPWF_22015 [Paenarthrobacter sp. NPDC089989]|uniref:hypothetical protein n=1 Tax=unclassified Paenarthrobacter TaxID=2634190 RepID=UPI003830A347
MLSSCTSERATEPDAGLPPVPGPTFASLVEAREAVAAVVGCESEPTARPIVNPDLAGFTAEYAVCGSKVQIEWFNSSDARADAAQVYMDTSQPLAIVEGENWIVADLSLALEENWSGKDLNKVAQEIGGMYTTLNGFKQS